MKSLLCAKQCSTLLDVLSYLLLTILLSHFKNKKGMPHGIWVIHPTWVFRAWNQTQAARLQRQHS